MLEDVHSRMLDREVVEGGDVPEPDHGDERRRGKHGTREEAGAALDRVDRAGDRAQNDLRQADYREDRGHVEQQDVLDHVGGEQLVGEAVNRRDHREQRRKHAERVQRKPPDRRVVSGPGRRGAADRQPAADVDGEGDRAGGERQDFRRPAQVRGCCEHLRRFSQAQMCPSGRRVRRSVQGVFTPPADRRRIEGESAFGASKGSTQ